MNDLKKKQNIVKLFIPITEKHFSNDVGFNLFLHVSEKKGRKKAIIKQRVILHRTTFHIEGLSVMVFKLMTSSINNIASKLN